MPWCESCDRFLNPNSVATDGSCPTCGRTVEAADRAEIFRETATVHGSGPVPDPEMSDPNDADAEDEERVRAPWHFWVMVGALGIYLGWRLVQGIFWAAHHWF